MNTDTKAPANSAPPAAEGAKPSGAENQADAAIPPASERGNKRPLFIFTLVLLIAGVLGFLYYLANRDIESTDDAFIDGHVSQISSRVAGRVAKVKVDDNQEVKRGDALVELDPRDFEVAVEKAEAQLAQAQAQSEQARAQADQARAQSQAVAAQLGQAKAQLVQAQAQVVQQTAQFEVAGINFNRTSSLYQKDARAVAKEQVDATRATLNSAQGATDAAKASVDAANAAVKGAEAQANAANAQAVAAEALADSAAAGIAVAKATVHDAELQLSYTEIHAAENGAVVRKSVEPGDYVQPAQGLGSLVRHDVWVVANFKETQLARMLPGQPVEVRVDAFPGRTLHGRVQSFQLGTGSRFSLLPAENATGNFVKVVQRVPVKIVFDEPPEILRQLGPGMSVEPRVNVGVKPTEAPPSAKP